MNRLPARAEADGRVRVGAQVLPADGDAARRPVTDVTVLVRPEAVVVSADDDGGDAVVVVATFRGSSTRLRLLRADGTEVLADVASHRGERADAGTPGLGLAARAAGPARRR